MKWTGNKLGYNLIGESHSEQMVMDIYGLPSFKVDKDKLTAFLNRRKAKNKIFSTTRIEDDEVIFKKGVNDFTVSDEIQVIIKNNNVRSGDYSELEGKPRPSHADYASYAKFNRTDFRGGREFSARLTAPYCVLGGIAKQILEEKGIKILAYVSGVGSIDGASYKTQKITAEQIEGVIENGGWALENQALMEEEISKAKEDLNSVGGRVECIVYGLKAGVGYTFAEGLESSISTQVFSIPAVHGIEFGLGFDLTKMRGSEANDQMFFDQNKEVKTFTNNAGGINGGISNGNEITLSVAFRPTPSIAKTQRTVNLITKENTTIAIKGRHDACIAVRALPVLESAVAIAILDNLKE